MTPSICIERTGTIRKLLKTETGLLREHLLRLDGEARARRFGHHVSDDFVAEYSMRAAEIGSLTFAYIAGGDARAAAELKYPLLAARRTAEAAFSVETAFSNQGIATLLMGYVINAARNRGIKHILLNCLAENAKMRAIAAKYDADISLAQGVVVGDISPPRADYSSVLRELMDDRFALMHSALDFGLRSYRAA